MDSKTYTYDGEDVTVTWDQKRCIHAEECVHSLPDVFDPDRRPWIDPDEAGAEAVEEAVHRCPTGALHLTRNGDDPEDFPDENEMTIAPDGPLYVRGHVIVENADGEVILEDTRVALCRCGLSENKPLCDGSHTGAFEDDGALPDNRLSGDADAPSGPVRFKASANGPILLDGPLRLEGTNETTCTGSGGALCRCGASNSKPYCDGSHAAVGFEG